MFPVFRTITGSRSLLWVVCLGDTVASTGGCNCAKCVLKRQESWEMSTRMNISRHWRVTGGREKLTHACAPSLGQCGWGHCSLWRWGSAGVTPTILRIHSVCSKEFPAQTSVCAFSLTHVLAVCKDTRASSV